MSKGTLSGNFVFSARSRLTPPPMWVPGLAWKRGASSGSGMGCSAPRSARAKAACTASGPEVSAKTLLEVSGSGLLCAACARRV